MTLLLPSTSAVTADGGAGGRWTTREITRAALVAGVAAVARLGYWFSLREQPLLSDAGQYHEIATYLAGGLGFSHTIPQLDLHPTAFRPPLYPVLLSLVYRMTGASQGVGRATAVVVGVAVVVATIVVVRRHAGTRPALVAGLVVALYPPIIANDTVTLTEGLSLLLLVLLLDAVLRGNAVWAGVWCGLLVLTRPSAQLLVVAVAAWLLATVGWRRAALATLATVVVVAPWVVRNQVVMGAPVIVTSNGFNLAAIHSAAAQQRGGFVDPMIDHAFDDMRLDQWDEVGWDRKLRARALTDLAGNPFNIARVAWRNTGSMFELTPSLNTLPEEIDGRNMTVRSWTLPLFYVVTVAGVVGLWRHRRRALAGLTALMAAYFALSSLFLVAPPRLRAPVDLMLCIGVGLLVGLWPRRSEAAEPDLSDELIDLTELDQMSPVKTSV